MLSIRTASAVPDPDERAIAEAAQFVRTAVGDHRLILLGEMHGTGEIPRLVGDIIASYASREPVVLGLEMPVAQTDVICAYLAGDGSEKPSGRCCPRRFGMS